MFVVATERRTKKFRSIMTEKQLNGLVLILRIYYIEGVVGMIIPNESKIYLIQLQHDDNPNIQAWKASE